MADISSLKSYNILLIIFCKEFKSGVDTGWYFFPGPQIMIRSRRIILDLFYIQLHTLYSN
jgi:hypothetical protein